MSNFPDFSEFGYQVIQELGENRAGGRVTYLASTTKTQQLVVIKQFQFATVGANWSDYDAYLGNLIDEANRINVKQLLPSLRPRFVDWLQKMTAPSLKNRFPNADAALKALELIDGVSNASKLDRLRHITYHRNLAKVLGLATLGLIALLGTIFIISRMADSRNHRDTYRIKQHHKEKKDRHDKGDKDDGDRYDRNDREQNDRYDKSDKDKGSQYDKDDKDDDDDD